MSNLVLRKVTTKLSMIHTKRNAVTSNKASCSIYNSSK